MSTCIYTIGSVTQVMKARKILADHSIAVNAIKLTNSNNNNGCIHGIEFSCPYATNIKRILSDYGIRAGEYTT